MAFDIVGAIKGAISNGKTTTPESEAVSRGDVAPSGFDPQTITEFFKTFKRECFEDRWVWERQWQRNIYYVLNRQWIYYAQNVNEWRDVRLAKNVPRPVSAKPRETVQSIRATLTAIKLGANVRPSGSDPKAVAVANVADEALPLLHDEHTMDAILEEHDYWFIVTGNAFLHSFWERDGSNGYVSVPKLGCEVCEKAFPEPEVEGVCPECGGPLVAATDETGQPVVEQMPIGRGQTVVLSPFELAFPNTYPRFEDVPGVIRMRWRPKSYYQSRTRLWAQVKDLSWQSQPTEQSMRLFRALPSQNDLGMTPLSVGSTGRTTAEEGLVEYELWLKPTEQYPQGLVARLVGDNDPLVLQDEDEGLPGPIPYQDVKQQPIFPFAHSGFDRVGGRVYASGPLDPGIQRINQLNQLDSMMQMMVQRMANPLWLIPKGSEVERLTGDVGVVVRWNPLTVQGNAKPERVPGMEIPQSLVQLREFYAREYEEATGTFDIIKGAKPTGVEAFSALQLLVERSQSRFANAFQSRGNSYRQWCKFALEMERQFGPDERTKAVLSPARGWTYETFKNADLQGSFTIVIEDGSTAPKTNLGQRANIEHLNQLGMLPKDDPDTAYAIMQTFGMTKLIPSLDVHVQAALQKQEAFEAWVMSPEAIAQSAAEFEPKVQEYQMSLQAATPETALTPPPLMVTVTPLAYKPWYNPAIHRQELIKWANGDRVKRLLETNRALVEPLLAQAIQELDLVLAPPIAPEGPPPRGGGAGGAMGSANANGGATAPLPAGTGENAQKPGAA